MEFKVQLLSYNEVELTGTLLRVRRILRIFVANFIKNKDQQWRLE